jgi:hypothetical protein
MQELLAIFCLSLLACPLSFAANGPAVTNAYADVKGWLHVISADGRDHLIGPKKWQSGGGYGVVKISPDGESVGWLAKQMLTSLQAGANYSYPVALELVIWKQGHVIRRFSSEQAIQNWIFLKGGDEVAFSRAPLHGPGVYCTLFEVESRKELAHWTLDPDDHAIPDWAKQLLDGSPIK